MERKVLIKAMLKARENERLSNAKVVGRYLCINNEKYDCRNIPEYLRLSLPEDQAGVIHAMSPFWMKLCQIEGTTQKL